MSKALLLTICSLALGPVLIFGSAVFDGKSTPAGRTVEFKDGGQRINVLAGRGVALADYNGDGVLDAFFVNENTPEGEGHRVYFGNGRGGLADSGQRLTNPANWSMQPAVGDVNGDGSPDVITGNTVWLNDGKGRFTAHDELIETGGAMLGFVSIADLNGDGSPDLCATSGWRELRLFLNNGKGHFRDTGQRLGPGSGIMGAVALGDVDGNRTIDAVTAGWRNAASDACPNRIWLNDGKGVFHESGQVLDEAEHHVHGVALGDVNGDGSLDAVFAITTPGRAGKVLLNDGKGRFRDSGQILGHRWAHNVVLGDLNGDGSLDVFLVCGEPRTGTPNEVWLNDGRGDFRDSELRLGNAFSWNGSTGDLNSDGRMDVVVANLKLVDSSKSPPVFGGQPAEVWLNATPQ